MISAIVFCEGQTEETFVREVIAPPLAKRRIFVERRVIRTSPAGRGGSLKFQRVLRHLRNTLLERDDTYVTTFFDLYGLPTDIPGVRQSAAVRDPIARARKIEAELKSAVVAEVGCRPNRFFPHIQPYEFEGLLFSDIDQLVATEPQWESFATGFHAARARANSPEHINGGQTTHPSARLTRILKPNYDKLRHGPIIAARIGLGRMKKECRHFAYWLARLEGLKPLRSRSGKG